MLSLDVLGKSVWLGGSVFREMKKCDNYLPNVTTEGRILPWNKPTEYFLPRIIMDFSRVQHNVSFLPKPQSSVSIELFYLSSNILINRARYSPRSQEISLRTRTKAWMFPHQSFKMGTWVHSKENMTGFRKLPRRSDSGCRAAGHPAVSHCSHPISTWRIWAAASATVSLVLYDYLAVITILYLPSYDTVSLIFKGCMWKVETWIYIM